MNAAAAQIVLIANPLADCTALLVCSANHKVGLPCLAGSPVQVHIRTDLMTPIAYSV